MLALKNAVTRLFDSDTCAPALPVAQAATADRNRRLVTDAISKGAELLHGALDSPDNSKYRIKPLLVNNVTKDMEIYYTESFGPSLSILTFKDDIEAVDIANDTEYGLSGAVFSKDLARALRIAQQIQSGAVHINSTTVHDEAILPHGGVKSSGWGRFNAQNGLDEFVMTKTITFGL